MIGIHLRLGEVEEISLKENTNLGRVEDIDRLFPPLLDHPLQIHKRSKRWKRSKQSHKRRRRRSTPSSSSSSSMHSVNDYGRYKRTRQSPQVAEVPTTLQPSGAINETPTLFYSQIMWCNSLQKTQVLNQNRKSGLLIGLSVRCSDFYPRSYALNLSYSLEFPES